MHLIVDALNVIGVRPDGWWKDRAAALARLVQRLAVLAEAQPDLQLTVVMDGRAPGAPVDSHDRLRVRYSRAEGYRSADDCIVALVGASAAPDEVEVVTSDRGLRARVEALGARAGSPRALLDRVEASLHSGR